MVSTHGSHVTLFYSSFCRTCEEVLPRVVAALSASRTMVVARRPTQVEQQKLPAVPALFIPEGVLGQTKPVLMVGSQIPEWLEQIQQSVTEPETAHG